MKGIMFILLLMGLFGSSAFSQVYFNNQQIQGDNGLPTDSSQTIDVGAAVVMDNDNQAVYSYAVVRNSDGKTVTTFGLGKDDGDNPAGQGSDELNIPNPLQEGVAYTLYLIVGPNPDDRVKLCNLIG